MISARFRHSIIFSIAILFISITTLYAGDDWVLLHKGSKGNSDVYYKKDSIKKIEQNITEVLIFWCNTPKKCALQQITKKTITTT
jgi:hypothetical protein